MSSKIDRLTPEQINLIPAHVEKWKNITLSTERLNREYVEKVINSIYKMLGYEQPSILFFDSPYAASNFIKSQTERQLKNIFGKSRAVDLDLSCLQRKIRDEFHSKVNFREIYLQVEESNSQDLLYLLESGKEYVRWEAFDEQIDKDIFAKLDRKSKRRVETYFGRPRSRFVRPGFRVSNIICQLDYFILNFESFFNIEQWKIYSPLFKLSNHIYLQEKCCIVCNRPLFMSFDSDVCLHAEGIPAIKFADGCCLYSYHRRTLPQKYGEVHPKDWQPKWLLTETNFLVREALVKGIGYAKIRRKLSIKQIDYWRNFMILAIEISSNSALVYLLEINVDTGNIERVKEVTPDVQSVIEAASFVDNYENWDIASAESKGFEMPF